ncbi:hypothetical protein K450DRAFT_303809 [Umbelopsis ramanniana AG]|uniref:Uncharacterized protein n=1 Tax=Umbelopsis ramanniana AG TaxID=1314678 RepID=A0AAD5E1A4_UMBRA|nr:uncharacterized protein K450DRAFT_303809 [Umbelopsis ramanniana AG]KAI8575089.1 hypothetical protein K450DRAFT_303809 [Umbelopsis ramanniana AG]
MSDSPNLLSPLLDDPLDIINSHQPHSEPGAGGSSHKPRKDPGPTPHDEAKSRHPEDPAANDEIPDTASSMPKDVPKTNTKAHSSKTENRAPSASTASVAPIPTTSIKRKHRPKPTTSLPPITPSTSSASYSELTSSSALTTPLITTTHLATVTSFTYVSSAIASISPTLVNESVNASSGGSPGANIAVPVIISVLSGVFLIAMIVFVMSKLKQKRKNRETWSMYREEPWRNPFRESLDQYHSHY